MIAELGHYALVLALALGARPVHRADLRRAHERSRADGRGRARPRSRSSASSRSSFAALAACYVRSDFSVVNVFENSHSAKPLIYKIHRRVGKPRRLDAAVGAHPQPVRRPGRAVRRQPAGTAEGQRARGAVLDRGGVLSLHPRHLESVPAHAEPPFEGRDLNPILQDLGLAIHPPLLYLGYVGFSISFSFAIAALIDGRIDAAWARWVRPWTLLAWMFLTLGIAMGSFWAYYTLGWGGWWFWDPVENASLMPWLAGTALLHSAVVMEKRDALKVWTILLAILAFSLSLIGTFLVRSGVLTSVHAFATDPMRGIFILAILRAVHRRRRSRCSRGARRCSKQGGLFAPISREGALVLNNLFLVSACATVFVGTLYPLALEALTGEKISVGAPFFNATFGPLFVPLLLAVPFGPLLAWKRGDLLGVAQRLLGAAAHRRDRHRRDLRGGRRRTDPGAVRDRARLLRHRRRVHRSRRAHRAAQGAVRDRARARARAAALGLGHRLRAFRARRHAARHRRRDPVGRRADRRAQARPDRFRSAATIFTSTA